MSKRKTLALLLAIVMVCSLFVSPALAAGDEGTPVAISDSAAPKFTDVDGHWAEGAITRWAEEGIIQGYGDGTVNPAGNLKRGELAAILTRLLGLREKAAANTFSDVAPNAWYADAVLKCAKAGIMLGDGAGRANPESPIDRQQTIVMVGRALGVKPAAGNSLDRFDDADDVADWAAPYMTALTDMGILSGLPTGDGYVVAPEVYINRASTFTLLDKAIAKYVTAPSTVTVDDDNKFVVINSSAEETGTVTVVGTASGVVVAVGTTDNVVFSKATVDTVKVDAPVDVTIERGSTVTDLDANAAADVDNKGTVTNLNTNADGVTFDGNKPAKVTTAKDVEPAKDSKGNEVTDKPASTGGTGGGSTRPSTTPDASVTSAIFHDTRADAAGVEEGKFVPDSALTDGYSVTSNKVSGVTEVTVNHKHIMQHQNGATPASLGYWTGYAVKAPEGTTSAKYAYLAEKTDEPALSATPLEDIDQKGTMGLGVYYNVNTEPTKPYFVVEWTVTKEDNTTETVTNWYHTTFATEKAPDVENVKLYEVHDKATFEALPAAVQTVMGGWDTLRDEAAVIADTDFPWLVVVYDRNIIGTMTFTATVNGQEAAVKPSGLSFDAATIGTEKCISFALTKFTNAAGVTSGAYLYEDDATTVYAPTVVSVNDVPSNAVTPQPKPGKTLIEVTFVDGSTTTKQSVVAAEGKASVTLPAAANTTDYFTGWKVGDAAELKAAGATVEITGATTITANYVTVTAQAAALRRNGPEGNNDPSVDSFPYATTYGEAGITFDPATNLITVDAAKLIAYQAKDGNQMNHLFGGDKKTLFVGLEYAAPAGATKYAWAATLDELRGATLNALSADTQSTYGSALITYIAFAKYEDGAFTFLADVENNADLALESTPYILWANAEGETVGVTKANLSRKTTPAAYTVTFKNGDTVVKEETAVEYNKTVAAPEDLLVAEGKGFLGWYVGDAKYTAAPIRANTTVTAKWTETIPTTEGVSAAANAVVEALGITAEVENGVITITIPANVKETFDNLDEAMKGKLNHENKLYVRVNSNVPAGANENWFFQGSTDNGLAWRAKLAVTKADLNSKGIDVTLDQDDNIVTIGQWFGFATVNNPGGDNFALITPAGNWQVIYRWTNASGEMSYTTFQVKFVHAPASQTPGTDTNETPETNG